MAIGTCWASGSWVDGAWAEGTWANVSVILGYGNLTIIKAQRNRTTYAQALETTEAGRNTTIGAQAIETTKAPRIRTIKR